MSVYHVDAGLAGITILGDLNDPDADYSFDILFVFKDNASGRIFYGRDSGCSCPSPFEDFRWKNANENSFTEVTKDTFKDFLNFLWTDYHRGDARLTDEKRATENKVKEILRVYHW